MWEIWVSVFSTRITSRRSYEESGRCNLLGITKSGTSVKGEIRLVLNPEGALGGLDCSWSLAGLIRPWSRSTSKEQISIMGGTDVDTYGLYWFRYWITLSVYNSRLSEHVRLSGFNTFVFHQFMNIVLLLMASVSVEFG